MKQFTAIKGRFSEARELPRIGKIRLGLKVASKNGGSHPTETEYFVCPPEVQEVYGETPTELDVLLPSNTKEDIIRSKYAMYGSGAGLKCHGNGEEAERYNEKSKEWEPMKCPCPFLKSDENPKGTCTAKTSLMVMLPLVSMGGCFQITTGSSAATKNINSSIDLIRFLTAGRIAFLPMKLRRVPVQMTHEGHKRTHFIMTLVLNATWQQALQLREHPDSMVIPAQYQIAAPLDENPELDPDDLVVDAETLSDSSEAELADIQKKLQEKQEATKKNGKPAEPAKPAPTTKPAVPENRPAAQPTQQPTKAIAPQPKEEPLELPPEKPQGQRLGTDTIEASMWSEVITYVDMNPDLFTLKQDWKQEHKIENVIRLTQKGQQAFLDYMRKQDQKFPY